MHKDSKNRTVAKQSLIHDFVELTANPYFQMALLPLFGIWALAFQIWDIEPYKLPIGTKTPLWVTLTPGLLSLLAAHILLVRIAFGDARGWLTLNPWLACLSVAAFEAAIMLKYSLSSQAYVGIASVGVMAGVYAFVPLGAFATHIRPNLKALIPCVLAPGAVAAYVNLLPLMWERLCNATALGVSTVLNTIGMETTTKLVEARKGIYLVHVESTYFEVIIWPACSGLEGICLFIMLLSLLLLLDWKLFRRWSFVEIYVAGFVYMFCVNILRITGFFLFCVMMGGDKINEHIIELFHSWAGWILYLIAFGIFLTGMYALASRERKLNKALAIPR